MSLIKLQLQPGVKKEGTNYSNEGFWALSDKVRFRSGYPEVIGGWAYFANGYIGEARALFNWTLLNGDNYVAVGTSKKLYYEAGSVLRDITPIRRTQARTNPFATTNGSPVVVVTDAGHGATDGAYVTVSGVAGTLNGIPAASFNRNHQITFIDANTYSINVGTNANATGTPVAGSITFEYEINPGLDVAVTGTGWGAGPWSRGTWGSGASISAVNQLRLWSFDNFGQDLIATVRNGGIYYWVLTPSSTPRPVALSTLAGATSDTPTVAVTTIVTEDRHVVCYGCNNGGTTDQDRLLIRWSTSEDPTKWTPTVTNTAGDYRLNNGSSIITVEQTRQETLIWTESALYSQQFVGAPFTFSFNIIDSNTSIAAPNAVATASGATRACRRGA